MVRASRPPARRAGLAGTVAANAKGLRKEGALDCSCACKVGFDQQCETSDPLEHCGDERCDAVRPAAGAGTSSSFKRVALMSATVCL